MEKYLQIYCDYYLSSEKNLEILFAQVSCAQRSALHRPIACAVVRTDPYSQYAALSNKGLNMFNVAALAET
jgi:hypothetical protein